MDRHQSTALPNAYQPNFLYLHQGKLH